ncbi:MAG: hypothetical protein A2090_04970 [Deltaproteobacteria bacterium GWD2_42_10]|nr:MAG: hypothetical protein A2067_02845 [Deltaproteobacteria bacterium GWB2_42_7]OGP41302.1 MAG: hypothetical protein A2090_04970 [Deltaproteobacteria bacterium GWD2_42_10]
MIFGETGKLTARRGGGHFCDEPSPYPPHGGGQGEDTVSPAERGEEQKCADNEVWQANRQFVK